MAFQLQDFNSILNTMVADMTALNPSITDYTEGSAIRSTFETIAKQLQRLQLFAFQGIKEGIKTGTFQNFNFQKLPASFASGMVRFFATSPQSTNQTINAGTQVQVPGTNLVYTANNSTVLPAGATFVDVLVTCVTLGSIGNTPANTITLLLNSYPFIGSINNITPIINGQDQESDAARLTRFQNFILSFSRGTINAIQSAAQGVMITDSNGNILERVVQALVVEGFIQDPTQPLGEVLLYIDNGSGTASGQLTALVNQTILGYTDASGFNHPGYLAAGVNLTTASVIAQPVNIICKITLVPGADSIQTPLNAKTAITSYLQTLTISETVQIASLIAAVMNTPGINNVAFSSPSADVPIKAGFKAVPGIINVNT